MKVSRKTKLNRVKVYIAGPYSKPDPCINTHIACRLWLELWTLGFAPYCLHLTHFQHTVFPLPYEQWLEYDKQFLGCCDYVLRFDGESSGADSEVNLAKQLGLPIYYSTEQLLKDYPNGQKKKSVTVNDSVTQDFEQSSI